MKCLILSLIAVAVAAPALARQASPPAELPKKEKKICRKEASTGSIMARRICHTQAEWAVIDKNNERNVDIYRARPTGPLDGRAL